jgi:DNA mismatch repair protein MutL
MSIQQLDPKTIDQIAAGEVLERPANLVKELVENSLDAGSTQIEVHINSGGREIAVHDNGQGIAPSDLPLAVQRYATSKISSFDDLFRLRTFGFRGEALASAAAVSRLKITTRVKGAERAATLISNFGKNDSSPETQRAFGTSVEIESLFENVPARLKFLKSETQESAQIKKTLKALALVHPHVEFLVRVDGSLVLHWPARSEWALRVQDVVQIKSPLTVVSEELGFQVQACFSNPNETAKTSQNIWIYVNDRWVQDRSLQQAVMEAYRNLLMHGEWPLAVVRLTVEPDQVDVNVHPSKSQVKFVDSRGAFRVIHHALRGVLEKAPWLETIMPQKVLEITPEPAYTQIPIQDWSMERTSRAVEKFSVDFEKSQVAEAFQSSGQIQRTHSPIQSRQNFIEKSSFSVQEPQPLSYEPKWGRLEVLGQASATYIVAQSAQGLVIVDQHAAHERVAFERLMRQWKNKTPEVQRFLIPENLKMDEELVEALVSQQSKLLDLGVELEQSGPDMVTISSCPSLVKESALLGVLEKLAREVVDQGESFQFESMIADMFASMACHSVVRAGQVLGIEEMQSLLSQMDEFGLSSFCPHGRPVFVEYPFRELEKDFGRIV